MSEENQIEKGHPAIIKRSKDRKGNRLNFGFLLQFLLIVVLVVVGIINWNNARGIIQTIDQKTAATAEEARPANLEIVTITDKNCSICRPVAGFVEFLKEQNVKIIKESNLDITESEAQTIINKFGMKQVPFFIVTGELTKTEELEALWSGWGKIQDDTFVLTSIVAPYRDLITHEVRGGVSVTYITDESCGDCYDVMNNKKILEGSYGVKIVNETTVDVSSDEGKELIEKYEIKKIPTFFVNNEIAVYQTLLSIWGDVGTIEPDGMYVFRLVEQLGTYYDLETKEIVNPVSQQNTDQ